MMMHGIMGKIFKSMVFIIGGAASTIGMMAIMVSFVRPEILDSNFIIGMTYRFFPAYTVLFLGAVLIKIDVGIWH